MTYTTLAQALKWVASGSGMNVNQRRDEVVELANRVRNKFYNWYDLANFKPTIDICLEVQCFCTTCSCEKTFVGVTLPRDVAGMEAMWHLGEPIALYGGYKEYRWGQQPGNSPLSESFDMGDDYPTERDIVPCGAVSRVTLQATRREDCGKVVKLDYLDAGGQRHTERITLANQPVLSDRDVAQFVRPGGVILPAGRVGNVILAQESGRILSQYTPDEIVPGYRRMKIGGTCGAGDVVLVRASRRYTDVYDDEDLVEANNALAWEATARALTFLKSTDASLNYEQKAESHFAFARNELIGGGAQETGKGFIRRVQLSTKIRNTGLRARGNRTWR